MHQAIFHSPIGPLKITVADNAITSLSYEKDSDATSHSSLKEHILLAEAGKQLDEFFAGMRTLFTLPLALNNGTSFQQSVWRELQAIPYGTTSSYKDIADRINQPKAYRAIGQANNRNPLPIFIPCHRVIASSGKLHGYNGELWRKQWLLQHEQKTNAPVSR